MCDTKKKKKKTKKTNKFYDVRRADSKIKSRFCRIARDLGTAGNDVAALFQVPRPRAEVFRIGKVCRGLRSHVIVPKYCQEHVVQDVDSSGCGVVEAEDHARQAQDEREHSRGHGGISQAIIVIIISGRR